MATILGLSTYILNIGRLRSGLSRGYQSKSSSIPQQFKLPVTDRNDATLPIELSAGPAAFQIEFLPSVSPFTLEQKQREAEGDAIQQAGIEIDWDKLEEDE